MAKNGIDFWFLVYDLLPIKYPHFFPKGISELHTAWLNNLLKFANVVCISKTVQLSLDKYIQTLGIDRSSRKNLYVYLGSDFATLNTKVVNTRRNSICKLISVGTLEPRKGYNDILDVCENLWSRDEKFDFHIIGRIGWNSEQLVERIRNLMAKYPSLFWHEDASDEELINHYETCDALVAASIDEGFGLPIVEAQSRRKPVILRNSEIFKEVANGYGKFFENQKELEEIIFEFLRNSKITNLSEKNMTLVRSWRDSMSELLEYILNDFSSEKKRVN
jgi:glycosyltransferase involved in cell wall biosynthesis